ncbi:hypothetical protein KP001_03580 [Geomonas subterranea]|uniref:Uncharacterized protein n=1 Tax=Geomonas subterranea TaxID=2847989 RepID=A0ABX8LIW9_9BACT|nr:hypothetical protein [Geomonas subterranea]QXE91637.1 hypothetical protein KP001_03580 [Geomonas subterranea]QXM10271.1 hypothetical protein KP002_03915 [Geomonas subterranea]
MLSPGLKAYIDRTAADIRKDDPETLAHLDDFELKAMILDQIRAHAEAEADALVTIHTMTAIIKSLAQLARLS